MPLQKKHIICFVLSVFLFVCFFASTVTCLPTTVTKNTPGFVPYLGTACKGENISMTTEQGGTRQARKIAADTQDLPLRGSRLTQIICASLWPFLGISINIHKARCEFGLNRFPTFSLFVLRHLQSDGWILYCNLNIFSQLFRLSSPAREQMQFLLALSSGGNVFLRIFFFSATYWFNWVTANKAISHFLISPSHFFHNQY